MDVTTRPRYRQVLAAFALVLATTPLGIAASTTAAGAEGPISATSCTLVPDTDGYLEIGTVADLRQFESGVCGWDQKYRQTADISSVDAWTGVGTAATPFSGVYDGGGHTLAGLSIVVDDPRNEAAFTTGFILRAAGATVSSLTMEVTVEGPEGVGAVIAYSSHSTTISDVHVSGTVRSNFYGDMGCVGGLVGQYYGSRILRSSFNGTVGDDDEWWAGGLVGCLDDESSIEQSTFTGTVRGGGEIGGLVGWMWRSEIVDSSAIATIDVMDKIAGGLVGNLVEDSLLDEDRTAITSSYSRSTFTNSGQTKGGLVGRLANALLTSTFFQYDLPGAELDAFGTTVDLADNEIPVIPGIFDGQMKNFVRYADAKWAIADGWENQETAATTGNVWGICEGTTAPFLLWEEPADPCVPDPACTLVPAPDGYLQIGDLDDLRQFASGVCGTTSNYRQVADIDASPTSTAPWIGAGSIDNPVRGTYDGDGHSITGLVTDVPFQEGDEYPGDYLSAFIRVARKATVKDLSIDATIDATYGSAVVVGRGTDTVISDVHATGRVQSVLGFNSGAGCSGGLAGEFYGPSSRILRSSFVGDVIDTGFWVGGLVGCFEDGKIEQSKFSGSVTGDDEVGALVGWQVRGTVLDSYGVGAVVASNVVGGLVGYTNGDSPGQPTNSATTSYVSVSIEGLPVVGGQPSPPTKTGGLFGHAVDTTADSSFWEAGLAGIDGLPAFGLDESNATMPTGPTSAADMKSFSYFDTANWAIVDGWEDPATSTNVWGICDGVGKPFLLWEHDTDPCPAAPADVTKPTVAITTPAEGAKVSQGASLVADFVCEDEVDGSGVDTCTGDEADGATIDTSTLGAKTFTVVAKDVAGNETTVTHNYTVVDVTKPTVTITTPAEGAKVSQGASLVADFVCEDEVDGSGVDTCTGDEADGATIDTSTLGAKTFTVVAKDVAGNETTVTHSYTVVDVTKPTVTITSPAEGAKVSQGASLVADFICEDEVDGSGVASCVGTVANGASIDTSTVGAKTFMVVAKDAAGNETTVTRNFTVVAPSANPQVSIRVGQSSNGNRATASVRPRGDVRYRITITNGAAFADRFVVRGDGSTRTCDVGYDSRGRRGVTRAVTAGTFVTPLLAPGESILITLDVEVLRNARRGATCETVVRVTSQTSPQVGAQVSALTTVR